MKKLLILHNSTKFEIFYTLYPFIIQNCDGIDITIKKFNPELIQELSGDALMFTRIFKRDYDDVEYVRSVIQTFNKNFNKVAFLDDSDGADSTHFEFIDLLDGYFKGKLLQDKSHYSKSMYGRQLFSNYYHEAYNVKDEYEDIREPISDLQSLKKLYPAFSIGYGVYPKLAENDWQKKVGYLASRLDLLKLLKPMYRFKHGRLIKNLSKKINYQNKSLKVSARFRYSGYPNSIGYQRQLFEKKIENHPGFLTGVVEQDRYNKELKNVFATLSPFGYGEVCFRDFESIINGSLLIKPDMSHMTTFPNIYRPYETYIPIQWDGADLLDKIESVLSNPSKYHGIIENSRAVYREELIKMNGYVGSLLSQIVDL